MRNIFKRLDLGLIAGLAGLAVAGSAYGWPWSKSDSQKYIDDPANCGTLMSNNPILSQIPVQNQKSDSSCWSRAANTAISCSNPVFRTVPTFAYLNKCAANPAERDAGENAASAYQDNVFLPGSSLTDDTKYVCSPTVLGTSDSIENLDAMITKAFKSAVAGSDGKAAGFAEQLCKDSNYSSVLGDNLKMAKSATLFAANDFLQGLGPDADAKFATLMTHFKAGDSYGTSAEWEGDMCKLKLAFYRKACESKKVAVSYRGFPEPKLREVGGNLFYDSLEHTKAVMANFESALKAGKTPMLSISCYHEVFGDIPDDCSGKHMALMVGREMRNGQCGYWIRNSWGTTACESIKKRERDSALESEKEDAKSKGLPPYHPPRAIKDGGPIDCNSNGDFFVPLTRLIPHDGGDKVGLQKYTIFGD